MPYKGNCPSCGSSDTTRYTFKPPPADRRNHKCTPSCIKVGRLCRRCRMLTGQWELTEENA